MPAAAAASSHGPMRHGGSLARDPTSGPQRGVLAPARTARTAILGALAMRWSGGVPAAAPDLLASRTGRPAAGRRGEKRDE
jgi:hypothetical protein